MFIPYDVDVPRDRWPIANWAIMAVTIAVFVAELLWWDGQEKTIRPFLLTGWSNPLGWFTSIFLHAGWVHIIGNMIFLWVFGNAICSKVGNWLYVLLYLLFGLMAGFAHMAMNSNPALGASGAINGVIGAYLVLYPLNTISCAYVLVMITAVRAGTFSVSGYWMVLLWLFFDIMGAMLVEEGVAYWAHLGGFAGGFVVAIVLIKAKFVTMERDDVTLLQALKIDKLAYEPYEEVVWRQNQERRAKARDVKAEIAEMKRRKGTAPPPMLMQEPGIEAKEGEEYLVAVCECGKMVQVPARLAGKAVRCPKCGGAIVVPLGGQESG